VEFAVSPQVGSLGCLPAYAGLEDLLVDSIHGEFFAGGMASGAALAQYGGVGEGVGNP
jgi:hypothetical protein